MEIYIHLDKVSKSFSKTPIFSHASYTFLRKTYHVVGKNGVGKSTLFRLIAGLDFPDSGSILTNNPEKIFYIPDDLAIYPFLKGEEFLSWIGHARSCSQNEISAVIDKFYLHQNKNTHIGDMSFGTKKKFLLASALIGKPDFIILDEPLNGLDERSQCVLLDMLKEKSVHAGIIFSSHHETNIESLRPLKIEISEHKLICCDL